MAKISRKNASKKVSGSNSHAIPSDGARPGGAYKDGFPPAEPAPVRSTDPNIKNTPASPAVASYQGDAASAEHPSGTAPPRRSNTQ